MPCVTSFGGRQNAPPAVRKVFYFLLIWATFTHRMASKQVVSFGCIALFEEDLDTLCDGQWINDAVAAFWAEYVPTVFPAARERLAILQPAAVMMVFMESDPDDLKGSLAGLKLASADLLLVPVNDSTDPAVVAGGTHWTLLAWHRRATGRFPAGFVHLDSSCDGRPDASGNLPNARIIASRLLPLLEAGGCTDAVTAHASVAQRNGFDCGLHMLHSMHRLVQEAFGAGAASAGAAAGAAAAADHELLGAEGVPLDLDGKSPEAVAAAMSALRACILSTARRIGMGGR